MPKKLTTEEFIERAKKVYPQYDYSMTEYKNAQSLVKIICPNCGLKEIKATYIISGRGCSCEKHKYITNKITKSLDKETLEEKFPSFEFDYSTFKGNFSNIKIKCKVCGNFFERNVSNLKTKKQGCPWCSGRTKTTEIIKKQLQEKYKDDIFDFSKVEYLGDERKQQIIICKKCKKEFMANTHDLLSKFGKKCPYCSRTIWKGEEKIKKWLEANGFFLNKDYFREAKFKNLKGKRNMPLRYDFYIPSENLLIEYNGEQHYTPRKKFGDKQAFIKRKKYDKIKEDYARENKINLLIIPYWDFDKIEEILNENVGDVERRVSDEEILKYITKHITNLTDYDSGAIQTWEDSRGNKLVDIEWCDGVSAFDFKKVMKLIEDKGNITKSELVENCL